MYIVGIRNFNHHAGCQKCIARGICQNRVMCFPTKNAILRTDDDFRARTDPIHHIKYSKIEEINNFDVISGFPISDPLHLLHIGVMKRMSNRWINGTKTHKKTFTKQGLLQFDNLLTHANQNRPSEINRPIRSVKDFPRWKATEHRTILLYVGMTILKDFITPDEYQMFLKLCCANLIASVDKYLKVYGRINFIEELLTGFIEDYAETYGKHTITSNFHNFCHVPADLQHFGNINSISTYPFENYLGKIKRKIRAYRNPLQQFARRASELENFGTEQTKKRIELKFPIDDGFQTIIFDNYQLSTRKCGDKWFLIRSADRIIKFEKAVQKNNEICIHGKEIPDKKCFFEYPYQSKYNNIYISNCIEQNPVTCTPNEIKCKLFRLPYKDMYVFQPLLHPIN